MSFPDISFRMEGEVAAGISTRLNFAAVKSEVTTANPDITIFANFGGSYTLRRALNRTAFAEALAYAQVLPYPLRFRQPGSLSPGPNGTAAISRWGNRTGTGRLVGQPMGQTLRCLARGSWKDVPD